jgi:hypothetical protein
VSTNTEQAIQWAMALHPDDRPPDVATFQEALEPNNNLLVRAEGETFVVQPIIRLPSLREQLDRYLAAAAFGLLILALLLTLFPFNVH